MIGPRLDALFGGFRVAARAAFRVTRNSDLTIQETEVRNSLLSTMQETLRLRKWGAAVRLEISDRADDGFLSQLQTAPALDLDDRDVYKVAGPVDLTALASLWKLEGFRELKEAPYEPQMPSQFTPGRGSVFSAIREQDILVHHPYESFDAVVRFIEQASDDPHVLAIKQTLYRTADDNPIISALERAAENGKQVTALVEIQARLDEENNIVKARALQKAGVHVVYGMVGLKTHCKAALVVRREHDGIRRYVHLATGNYNPTTAKIYTDLSFFTCRPEFGEDASSLFNLLTGYSQGHDWKKLIVAPMSLADRLIELIDRERQNAEAGLPARIIAKMNSLVDPGAIEALYAASGRGRPDRPDHPRDLLPSAGDARSLGEHPGHQHRRPVPRTLTHQLFPERRQARGLPLLRRLDAAQLPPTCRDHVPDRRSAAPEPDRGRHPRSRSLRQREGPRPRRRRHLSTNHLASPRRSRDPFAGRVPEHGPRTFEQDADSAIARASNAVVGRSRDALISSKRRVVLTTRPTRATPSPPIGVYPGRRSLGTCHLQPSHLPRIFKKRITTMKLRARLTPQVESMESRALLTSIPLVPVTIPAVDRIVAEGMVKFSGTFRGAYTDHENTTKTGKEFDISGTGSLTNFGDASVAGIFRDPGDNGTNHSDGTIYVAGDKGTLAIHLVGPAETNNSLSDHYTFTVTGATGKYKGDTDTGIASLVLIPANTKTGPPHNEMTLVLTSN